MDNTFTCAACGEVYRKEVEWDARKDAETRAVIPIAADEKDEDLEVFCEDCFLEFSKFVESGGLKNIRH